MEGKGPRFFFVAQVTIVCLTGEPGFAQCSATGETCSDFEGGWLEESSYTHGILTQPMANL